MSEVSASGGAKETMLGYSKCSGSTKFRENLLSSSEFTFEEWE